MSENDNMEKNVTKSRCSVLKVDSCSSWNAAGSKE